MQAVVKTKMGKGNVELQNVREPKPEYGQVKIEVKAAGICGSDIHIWDDDIKIPMNPPVVIGHEFSGVISAIGYGVKEFKPGERVVSETTFSSCRACRYCRAGEYNLCKDRRVLGYWANGAFADYCIVPQECIHRLPASVDFFAGALAEPLACCVHAITELTAIAAGEVVVVIGPGTIGLLAMQVAMASGGRLIVMGTSKDGHRLSIAKGLGSETVVDVQKEDAEKIIGEVTDGMGVDVVLECSGAPSAVELGLELVRKGGKYTQIGLLGRPLEVHFEKIAYKEITVMGSFSHRWESWEGALDLLSRGKITTTPIISTVLPISSWQEGFEMHRMKEGVKTLLTPV